MRGKAFRSSQWLPYQSSDLPAELSQEAQELINSTIESNLRMDENSATYCDIEVASLEGRQGRQGDNGQKVRSRLAVYHWRGNGV